jgi:hypothetical protein
LVLATPGNSFPNDAFCAKLIDAWVRFQVTGKENVAPCERGPVGKVEFTHWKVLCPVVQPLMR